MGSSIARSMTTAVDTNVVVALWDLDPALSSVAQAALDSALARGGIVIAAPVFAELMACPGRDQAFLDTFCRDATIAIDWNVDEATWRIAGGAFQVYATRRRRQGEPGPRRILADFVIGAHALHKGHRLLTLDDRLYRAAFPGLRIVIP
jgi:predicted nucleic acid-binding protein